MQIVALKETASGENRTPLIPADVEKLKRLGADVSVEAGLGESIYFSDADYEKAGAVISDNRQALLKEADMVLRLRKPSIEDIALLKKGAIHVSFLDPFHESALIDAFAKQGVSAISMEMVPRSTRAQKMDAISSQASLAGYVAVTLAAEEINKIIPMMMTPAGTLSPARVFIIGVGVAGLQAIATAKRMGARVEAFDTRPVVKEEVQSLGAKFVEIDLGETGQDENGYAKALTEEQLAKQREGMAKACKDADIVITTAKLFGRKAPIIVTKEMVANMKPGSIIVDLAAETGGNVEGTKLGEIANVNGVRIIGYDPLPCHVAGSASQMYSSNLYKFIDEFWNKESSQFELKTDDDIIKSCLVTHDGTIVNDKVKQG